jgi:hypothetical protein
MNKIEEREREREKRRIWGDLDFLKQSTGFGKMQLNIHWS